MTSLRRIIALGALLAVLPAKPSLALYRSGLLSLRFDNITLREPGSNLNRSYFSQDYELGLGGNLLHRGLGSFDTKSRFAKGADVNQAVNEGAARFRDFEFTGSAQVFGSRVRKYFQFDPNYSLLSRRITSDDSSIGAHTFTDSGWGFNSGLSVRILPIISVARQYNTRKNPDSALPTDQRVTLARDSLFKSIKKARMQLTRDRRKTRNLLSSSPSPIEENQRGSLSYNTGRIKPLGVDSISMRSDYQYFARDEFVTQRSLNGNLTLRSVDIRASSWTHKVYYTNDTQGDFITESVVGLHNLLFNSNKPLKRGSLGNALSGNITNSPAGTGFAANLAPTLNLEFAQKRIAANYSGQAGWNRSAAGAKSLSDSLSTRLDLRPRPNFSYFLEARTSGNQPLNEGDRGGSRSNRYGFGSKKKIGSGDSTLRYDRTEQRIFSSDSRSLTDQVNLTFSLTPAPRLQTSGGGGYSTTRSGQGRRFDSKNFYGNMNYSFLSGLRLTASFRISQLSQHVSTFGAAYTLGKTSLNLNFQHSELPSATSFSHLSCSLSRRL